MMVLDEIKRFLLEGDNFLVSAHISPDGDAVGSVLVFSQILEIFGKNYRIVLQDAPQDKFAFLSNYQKILLYSDTVLGDFNVENVIALDCGDYERMGKVRELIPPGVPLLNIDHHPDNDSFGDLNFVNKKASGNCELIYEVIQHLDIEIDHRIASQIYTSIMFDTGRFRFSNTTGAALKICGEMINCGADPLLISNSVYSEKPKAFIIALQKVLNSLEFHFDDKVGFMSLGYEDSIYDGKVIQDVDGLVDNPLTVKGVEVSIFAREQEPGKFKISLRAQDAVKVNEIAQVFDGGGHFKAAGCRIPGEIEEVKEKLLEETKKHL